MRAGRGFGLALALAATIAGACAKSGAKPDAGSTGAAGTTGAAGSTGAAGTTGAAGAHVDAGTDAAPIVPTFAAQAIAFSKEYLAWGRVDDELRWAPGLCRIPNAGVARLSESKDETTHGRKLYSVFAKSFAAYPAGPHTGQVIVKQSWVPELVTDADAGYDPTHIRGDDAGDHFYPYARGDGGIYRAAAPAGLYLMFKVDPATADTDAGWVYATITAAGDVTAAGRVASCMGCHEVATHERLFGVPTAPH